MTSNNEQFVATFKGLIDEWEEAWACEQAKAYAITSWQNLLGRLNPVEVAKLAFYVEQIRGLQLTVDVIEGRIVAPKHR